MGKTTGFIEISRKEREYESDPTRLKHNIESLLNIYQMKYLTKAHDVWIVEYHIVIRVAR